MRVWGASPDRFASRSTPERRTTKQKLEKDKQVEFRAKLTSDFGTTAQDFEFWERASEAIELAFFDDKVNYNAFLKNAEILRIEENQVFVGLGSDYAVNQMSHPGLKKKIERELKFIAGREMQIKYKMIGQAEKIPSFFL